MKRIKRVSILVMVAILSLLIAPTACTAEDSMPDFEGCEMCHPDVAANFTTSMHYNAYGMKGEYERGAAGHYGMDMDATYEKAKCVGCHVTTCTKCHLGYKPEMGHGDECENITIDTCDPCHKTKQTSTFVGDMPKHKSKGPHADVHYEKGLTCMDCHSAEEMHGDGNTYTSQMEAVTTACEDCHSSPGKVVKEMDVTQYSLDVPSHKIHDGKLDCTACHVGWVTTCVNCHLDTLESEGIKKTDGIVIDEFYLLKATDGLIKPFLKMTTSYGDETHTGYGEWMSHTITADAKDCAFCHENREVFCEGCEGQMLGVGGSFIPQETIDRIIDISPTGTTAPAGAPAEDSQPDFEGCEMCHPNIAANFATSMHYNAYGMKGEYERGAAGHFGIDMDAFYEEGSCAKCHVTTCTKCHLGYKPEMGHGDECEEITIDTCDPCHFKKQTSTFVGDMPAHKSKGPHADIHYEKGLICTDCHSAEEMHGDGNTYTSQMEAITTECEDCHSSPGKVVKEMDVTQYSLDVLSHKIHDGKLDCTACHTGWMLTCVNCHLETRKPDAIVTDEFILAKASDGMIKPFLKMRASYGDETHIGYGVWMPHTITAEAKDCAFCHENGEVLCEGCEGQMLGDGGSFIPQETIDYVLGMAPTSAPVPAEPPAATPAEGTPGFAGMFAVVIIGIVYLVIRKRE